MYFRHPLLILLCAASLIIGLQPGLFAQAPEVPPAPSIGDRNAWAQFGIGSWKLVRVYTESLDENGEVENVSVTETKTTLEKADEKGFSLNVEATVEVAGKIIPVAPMNVAYGYHGELQGQSVEVTQLGSGEAEICSRKYVTSSRRIVVNSDTTQCISLVEYSDTVAPYFLKRTTESIDIETKEPNYHAVVEVVAVDMPEKVLTEVKSAAHVKTLETYRNGNGKVTLSKVTLEVHCDSVPGGVVSHTSRQINDENKVTRSTLELIDYEAIMKAPDDKEPPAGRRRLFQRRRN